MEVYGRQNSIRAQISRGCDKEERYNLPSPLILCLHSCCCYDLCVFKQLKIKKKSYFFACLLVFLNFCCCYSNWCTKRHCGNNMKEKNETRRETIDEVARGRNEFTIYIVNSSFPGVIISISCFYSFPFFIIINKNISFHLFDFSSKRTSFS